MSVPDHIVSPFAGLLGYGGLPLALRTWGLPDDPSIVLLHNGTRKKESWNDVAEALAAAGRYVVAFDLRGHGESGWASDGRYDLDAFAGDLLAILEALPSRPVIVGASLGGLIALAAISTRSELVASGLILVDVALSVEGSAIERFADHALGQQAKDIQHWDPKIIGAFRLQDVTPLLEANAGAIKIPTLVLRGAKSDFVTSSSQERLRSILPSAEFRDIEESGHFVVEDEMERFNSIVLEFLERCVPRQPVHYESGSAARVLRDTLGCFVTGITVVTSLNEAGLRAGCTVNSFASVSLEPPLILFSLDLRSPMTKLLELRRSFAVNVLHMGQQPTSVRFAGGEGDRFAHAKWETWDTGVPILCGSLAAFECTLEASHYGGDHRIFIGRVIRARAEPRRDPLLFFRGKYRRLHFR